MYNTFKWQNRIKKQKYSEEAKTISKYKKLMINSYIMHREKSIYKTLNDLRNIDKIHTHIPAY